MRESSKNYPWISRNTREDVHFTFSNPSVHFLFFTTPMKATDWLWSPNCHKNSNLKRTWNRKINLNIYAWKIQMRDVHKFVFNMKKNYYDHHYNHLRISFVDDISCISANWYILIDSENLFSYLHYNSTAADKFHIDR